LLLAAIRLGNISVLYLDGSRVHRLDADALSMMWRLRTVSARRMRSSLTPVVDAVIGSRSVRLLALADNFVVCSCRWLRTVERLAAVDVVVVDWVDAAPRCSDLTVRRCRSHGPTTAAGTTTITTAAAAATAITTIYYYYCTLNYHHHHHRNYTTTYYHYHYH